MQCEVRSIHDDILSRMAIHTATGETSRVYSISLYHKRINIQTSNNCGIDWLARYAFASSIDILNALQIHNQYNTRFEYYNSAVKLLPNV